MGIRKSVSFVVATVTLTVLLFTMATPEASAGGPGDKLGRGLMNISVAPLEIPVSMVNEAKKNPLFGLFFGPVIGAVNCVTRLGAGVVELITFAVPPYDQPIYDKELGETIWE